MEEEDSLSEDLGEYIQSKVNVDVCASCFKPWDKYDDNKSLFEHHLFLFCHPCGHISCGNSVNGYFVNKCLLSDCKKN